MRLRLENILLIVLFACCFALGEVCEAQQLTNEKVFIDWGGLGKELVIDISGGRLRIRKAGVREESPSYLVDGLRYHIDDSIIEANYRNHEIKKALAIQDGNLLYEGTRVTLPPAVKMRNVWQAVLWEGWVICLGRTSKTDGTAYLKPPFLATELITFNVERKVASVRYVNFDPPSGTRLFILAPR